MFNFVLFITLMFCISQFICPSAAVHPPACVLACVNTQPMPSAYELVCRSTDVRDCLTTDCKDPGQAADYFHSICAASGHEVAAAVTSSSSSVKSSTTTSSGSPTTATSASSNNTSTTSPGPTDSGASSNVHNARQNFAFCGTMAIVLLAISARVL